MELNSVTLKGTPNGLVIIIREDSNFAEVLSELEEKILSAGQFFRGASMNVLYRGKFINKNQENQILSMLIEKSGAQIKSFGREPEKMDVGTDNMKTTGYKTHMNSLFFKGIEEGPCKFIRGTVRSGSLIKSDGNVVIIGDVNPGAEIKALGNIIVMGVVRGIVHAGADGNKAAVIVAMKLKPVQLRIADIITRAPDEPDIEYEEKSAEMAYVKDGYIIIDKIH